MTISVTQTASSATSSVSLTIDSGSGNNRLVSGHGLQDNIAAISDITYNGVSGNLAVVVSNGSDQRSCIYYWLDTDLPSSAGAYTLSLVNGLVNVSTSGCYAEGVAQSAPSDTYSIATDSVDNVTAVLSLASSGALLVNGCVQNTSSGTLTVGSGQTDILAVTVVGSSKQGSSYQLESGGDKTVSYATQNAAIDPNAYTAAAFDAAAAVGSLDGITQPITQSITQTITQKVTQNIT